MRKLIQDMTEVELTELLSACANQLKVVCAVLEVESPLFVLLLFNDPAIGQYVSNCNRSDMVKALREAANRLESNDYLER